MSCPSCAADTTTELLRRTTLGYRMFRCRACRRTYNERTGTPFNHLQVPTDIALLVVLWRLRYKLSVRNVAEMFLTRGFTFTHETVRAWEERLAPLVTEQLKAKRGGKAGRKWHVDETYVKVEGRWYPPGTLEVDRIGHGVHQEVARVSQASLMSGSAILRGNPRCPLRCPLDDEGSRRLADIQDNVLRRLTPRRDHDHHS